jgi:hypothetical protein
MSPKNQAQLLVQVNDSKYARQLYLECSFSKGQHAFISQLNFTREPDVLYL